MSKLCALKRPPPAWLMTHSSAYESNAETAPPRCDNHNAMDTTELTDSQQAAFGELQAITNGLNPQSELTVLRSCNWNVQVSVQGSPQ